jgi:hypothetical protein
MPFFSNESTRRRAVRALGKTVGQRLALFSFVDEHLHTVASCGAGSGRRSRLATAVALTLGPIVQAPLGPVFPRAVESRSHLVRLVRYNIEQPARHNLGVHPALWSGSCFQDLVGARVVDGLDLRIWDLLPRMRVSDLYEVVGLPLVKPVTVEQLRALGARRMVRAAAAAVAGDPHLSGRSRPVVRARRAVAHLGQQAGISLGEVAWALEVTRRCVRMLHAAPAVPDLSQAIRLQLALELAAGQSR